MRKFIIFFIIFTFVQAQNAHAHTLEQIFALIDDFGSIKAAKFAALAAQKDAQKAQASYLPQINLLLGAKASSASVDIFEPKTAAKAELEASWLLYDLSRDAQANIAELAALAAQNDAKAARAAAKLAAAKTFYAALALKFSQIAAAKQCAALERAASEAQKLAESGLRELEEAQLISAASANCWAKSASLRAEFAKLEANLFALTGSQIKASGSEDESVDFEPSALENIAQRALEKSSQAPNCEDFVQVKNAKIASIIAEQKRAAALAEFAPKVFIKASAGEYFAKLRTSNFGPLEPIIAQNSKESAISANALLGISINLFAGKAHTRAYEAARLAELAALENLAAKKAEFSARFSSATAAKEAAATALLASIKSEQAASAAAASLEQKYLAGLAIYSDFLRANAQSFSARSDVAAQQAALASAQAQISYLLGEFDE